MFLKSSPNRTKFSVFHGRLRHRTSESHMHPLSNNALRKNMETVTRRRLSKNPLACTLQATQSSGEGQTAQANSGRGGCSVGRQCSEEFKSRLQRDLYDTKSPRDFVGFKRSPCSWNDRLHRWAISLRVSQSCFAGRRQKSRNIEDMSCAVTSRGSQRLTKLLTSASWNTSWVFLRARASEPCYRGALRNLNRTFTFLTKRQVLRKRTGLRRQCFTWQSTWRS